MSKLPAFVLLLMLGCSSTKSNSPLHSAAGGGAAAAGESATGGGGAGPDAGGNGSMGGSADAAGSDGVAGSTAATGGAGGSTAGGSAAGGGGGGGGRGGEGGMMGLAGTGGAAALLACTATNDQAPKLDVAVFCPNLLHSCGMIRGFTIPTNYNTEAKCEAAWAANTTAVSCRSYQLCSAVKDPSNAYLHCPFVFGMKGQCTQ